MSGNRGSKTGAILGAVIGAPIGFYAGISLLIPVGCAMLIYKLLRGRAGDRNRIVPAVSIQGAHVLWMALGAAMTRQLGPVAIDVVVMGGLLCWVWARPSALPLWTLAVVQAAALAVNGAALFAADLGSLASKALLVHVLLRVAGIAANLKALPPRKPAAEDSGLSRAA
jgi:hypothetical protein